MEVWQAIKNDKECGAKRLVSEYGDRLFGAAFLLCQDAPLAEDLVFRTFNQSIRKIGQYQPSGDFFSWLYTILLNYWRMDVRKNRLNLVYMGSALDLPPVEVEHVGSQIVDSATDDEVQAALDELPSQIRDVVVLKYFKDLSVEQIAEVLAVPQGTVKSRLFTARKILLSVLTREKKNRKKEV
ncbi:MAG: RNA polymerase sigma factor [Kiritimatiellae bacterium]|nr:RNA polymerase sigma factor [Kiritimatiellia bacterium]